jgi:hypothetical protein
MSSNYSYHSSQYPSYSNAQQQQQQQQPVAWWTWDDPLAESSVNLRAMRSTECNPQPYSGFSNDLDLMNPPFSTDYYDAFSNALPGALARSLSMTDLNPMDGIGDMDLSARPNRSVLGDMPNTTEENDVDSMTNGNNVETPTDANGDDFQCPCCGTRCEGGLTYHTHVANCYMTRFLPNSSPAEISNVIATLSPRGSRHASTTSSDQISPAVTPSQSNRRQSNFSFNIDSSATRPNHAQLQPQQQQQQQPAMSVLSSSNSLPVASHLTVPTPQLPTMNVTPTPSANAPNASANDALAAMFLLRTCVSQLDLHQRISLMSSLFQLSRSTADHGDHSSCSPSPMHVDEKVISLLYSPAPNAAPTNVGQIPPLSELNLDTHPSNNELEE